MVSVCYGLHAPLKGLAVALQQDPDSTCALDTYRIIDSKHGESVSMQAGECKNNTGS